MKTAAPDFKIFWDEAYIVHHLTDEIIETPVLLNECKKYGTEDRVFMFTSTSKITFPGAGIGFIGASPAVIAEFSKRLKAGLISADKLNQLRHVRFLKDADGLAAHMAKHAAILRPKFEAVLAALRGIAPLNIASWTEPKGGYFVSCDAMPGTAKRTLALCAEAGVTMTPAGATYPGGNDPADSNIRIAPSFPPVEELEQAMQIFCLALRMAALERLGL